MENLESINGDLLADIVSRVDGLSLASLGCTSSYLKGIACDDALWKNLCHLKWPSTVIHHNLIHRFDHFFADSFPFLFYDEAADDHAQDISVSISTSPCDFVSFVDVYYMNQCVFSKVVHGIPEAVNAFQCKVMDTNSKIVSDEFRTRNDNETLASVSLKLMKDVRLSWIMMDVKTGKAVNLSTWKPLGVQSLRPHQGDYVMHFGSVIPVEESLLSEKLAMCKITTKFRMIQGDDRLLWREISTSIEDLKGALADGKTSLMILSKALYSLRTTKQVMVENGFKQYEKRKKDMNRRQELGETVANGVYAFTEMAVLAVICNALVQMF